MNAPSFQSVPDALQRIVDGTDQTADEMHALIGAMMDGRLEEAEIAALLIALRMKGEAVSEIVGAARAMRERATSIPARRSPLVDTCGTGGDRLHTFNISTAAALVVAGAGLPVAKHGNRSVSSSSGSADVLEALGVNIGLPPETVARCVDNVGIGFCFAPLIHGAMKHAAPVRKRLGIRTIFNLLGPLTNPAGAEFQLIGTSHPQIAAKLAGALSQLGGRRAVVVCGSEGLDEVSLWGETKALVVSGEEIVEQSWTADCFGLKSCHVEELQVESAEESATVIREVLEGRPGPARDIVVANAAAALWVAEREASLESAAEAAQSVIDSGRAAELCHQLAAWTNSHS